MKASGALSTGTWRQGSPASCAPRPDRFRLSGPSARLDPRVNAHRRDLADVVLADILFAPHYAAGIVEQVDMPSVMLRAEPRADARAVSQLMRGEAFHVLDVAGGWAWGRCGHDDYVGYLPQDALGPVTPPDHRVVALAAPVFMDPDIKSPVLATWPIGACFTARREGDFLATADGFVHAAHVAPLDAHAADPVAVAGRLLGQPYLWGGRGAGGIDCSGLVQLALGLAGIAAPRDSDMQRDRLGRPIPAGDALRRGDLIFFPGHVGLMTDETNMIHATAHSMTVTVEPLATVVARLSADHAEPILARKRL